MRKIKVVLFSFASLLWITSLHAETWYVHNYDDVIGEGSLRVQIQSACETPGDDLILFMTPAALGPITIRLLSPLSIPRNCQGHIHVMGHESHETRLVMSSWPATTISSPEEYCSFNVYSDGNTLERLTLYGGETDICLFGRFNHVAHNNFGRSDAGFSDASLYGVLTTRVLETTDAGMNGSQNMIEDNVFLANAITAIQLGSDSNVARNNRIGSLRQFGILATGVANQIYQNTIQESMNAGILAQGDENQIDHNSLQASRARGIVYEGSSGHILSNTVADSGQEGILYRGDGGEIASNSISNTFGDGMALEGRSLLIRENQIHRSRRNGIFGKIDASIVQKNEVSEVQVSGMLLHGQGMRIATNQVREAMQDGMVLQGNHGEVLENDVHSNGGSGVVLIGSDFWLYKNRFLANGGCPEKSPFPIPDLKCLKKDAASGTGILIEAGSTDNTIGGPDFESHANIIQYNSDAGIIVRGGSDTYGNWITRNVISNNYGAEPDLDLFGDGITSNDLGDVDVGPNSLLNYADYLQAFPLVPSPTGDARYWSWGLARHGAQIEMYRVSDEDVLRARTHGGAHIFLGDSEISARTFRIPPHANFNSFEDQKVSLLSHDSDRNTSEFSLNVEAGRDFDMDGIIDSHEIHEGAARSASRYDLTDTDGDGLPDSVEDRNRNGSCDAGETCTYSADTDHDGLNDWSETHGDAIYHPDRFDTDPFHSDTDGDGLMDGQEDTNQNGVWDNDQGESSPLYGDSDNDGVPDGRDNCRHIPNPAQEAWMCSRSL